MKKVLAILFFLFLAVPAYAGSGTLAVTPGSGATIATTTDGSSNNLPHNVVCDYSAGANCAQVDSSFNLHVQSASACNKVVAINQTASTDIYTSTNKVHFCGIFLFTSLAQAVSVVEGTGTTCATGTAALVGGTTASSTVGLQFFAGQGLSMASGTPFLASQTGADHICILQSSTGIVSGFISFSDS